MNLLRPFKFLLDYIRLFPVLIPLALLLSIAGQLLECLGIGLLLPFIQVLTSTSPGASNNALAKAMEWLITTIGVPRELPVLLSLIFGLFVAKAAILMLGRYLSDWAYTEYRKQTQVDLYRAILNSQYQFLTNQKAGHISNTLLTESERAAGGMMKSVNMTVELVSISAYLTFCLLLSWKMTLAAVGCGALLMCGLRPVILSGRRHGRQMLEANSSLHTLIQESTTASASIKGMSQEAHFQDSFGELATTVQRASIGEKLAASFIRHISEPLVLALVCTMVYVAVQYSKMDLSSFLVLVAVLQRALRRLTVIPGMLHALYTRLPSLDILERWDRKTHLHREIWGDQRIDSLEQIRLSGATWTYGDDPVIRDLDLVIERGETVALVGPSGSGKSTIVKLLLGLLQPYEGSILINGQHELRDLDATDWRKRIGYVGQEVLLFNASVERNIAFFDAYTQEEIRDATQDAFALEFIERMPQGFDTEVGDRGVRLSGGQRQRLALARALVRKPELLVLDEATSDLDAESEEKIQQSIQRLRGKVTLLIVAHRLATIREADRICVLVDGNKHEEGSLEELLARDGEFASLWRTQALTDDRHPSSRAI